jgi:hypothetical protein
MVLPALPPLLLFLLLLLLLLRLLPCLQPLHLADHHLANAYPTRTHKFANYAVDTILSIESAGTMAV